REVRGGDRAQRREVQERPRLGQVEDQGGRGGGRGQQDRRARHAVVLHQRQVVRRSAAVRRVQGEDRGGDQERGRAREEGHAGRQGLRRADEEREDRGGRGAGSAGGAAAGQHRVQGRSGHGAVGGAEDRAGDDRGVLGLPV